VICRARGSFGFTLIEILVVLSIVGILAASSIPILSNVFNVSQLKREAQNIVAELRLAQEMAETKKTTCCISFKSKSIFYESAQIFVERYDYFKGKYVNIKSIELPKKFDFKEDKVIKFSSSGSPPAGGSGTIVLKDAGGREKKIIVSSIGRIRIE